MHRLDKDELKSFISSRIKHDQNPESFKYQLELEIQNHLKRQERNFKAAKIRLKNEQLQNQQIQKRKQLEAKLELKKKKSSQNKSNHIEERVKSMAQLRIRKQQYVAEKNKQNRRKQLKEALEKIKQIERQRQQHIQNKLHKTQSYSRLVTSSMHSSRLQKRNESMNKEYDALVVKLQSKGIFAQSKRKALSQLYAKRAKVEKLRLKSQQQQANHQILAKLSKIQHARNKKVSLMHSQTQKLKRNHNYQQQLAKAKLKEMHIKQRIQNKKILERQATKLQYVQQMKQSDNDYINRKIQSIVHQDSYQNPKRMNRIGSFREQIQRQIQNFKIGKK